MPNKIQQYTELAAHTAQGITGSLERWTAFLDTAARLYKCPFDEQFLIYAQRPEATACADYALWNERMGGYVRKGSKGIALLDSSGDELRLGIEPMETELLELVDTVTIKLLSMTDAEFDVLDITFDP